MKPAAKLTIGIIVALSGALLALVGDSALRNSKEFESAISPRTLREAGDWSFTFMDAISKTPGVLILLLLGTGLSVLGCAIVARVKKRSLWWSTVGIIVGIGPIVAALLPRRTQ